LRDTKPYTKGKERGLLTREGVGSFEKPKLALRVLLFLRRNGKTGVLNMLPEGWNRKTAVSSLMKLEELNLVSMETHKSFPRFEKRYCLTQKGEYVANFVRHLEAELSSSFGMDLDDLSNLPKGCLPILVYILSRRYQGISRMLNELNISPHQTYRCLSSMESRGILCREEHHSGKRIVSSYCLSENGVLVAVAVDALDKALKTGSSFDNRPA
jgi:DNA-binding HxlR family transcriptional regulator